MNPASHDSLGPVRSRKAGWETEPVALAVADVLDGDRAAFGRVVEILEGRVYALSLMIVRDPSVAEEVAQDSFVRAFRSLSTYDPRRPFYPWIATIAVRLSQSRLRQTRRRQKAEGADLPAFAEPQAIDDPLDELISDEEARRLWQTVSRLPSGERTAVYLHYRQDLSVREIAVALGVTTGTVKTFLFRARKKLRLALAQSQSRVLSGRRSRFSAPGKDRRVSQ